MKRVLIVFELLNGEKISIVFTIMQNGWGDMDDGIILCSPKEMGMQKSVADLVKLLEDSVRCDSEYGHGKIFKEDVSGFTSEDVKKRAMEFLEKVKNIPSMDDIKEITVDVSYDFDDMRDEDGHFIDQSTKYTYNRVTNKYTYTINGSFYNTDTYFTDYKEAERI